MSSSRWCLALLLCLGLAGSAQADDSIYEFETGGAQKTERLPLIVLLHGAMGSPKQIAPLLEKLPVRARVVAPRGLFATDAGWIWYAMQPDMSSDERDAGITKAADVLVKLVAALLRARPTCGRPIVVGFSQGGVLSYALAARSPSVVAVAFPMSGYLPRSFIPNTKPANAPRIEAFHGSADDTFPLTLDRDTSSAFGKLGFAASVKVYPGVDHDVVAAATPDLYASIARSLREMGCTK